MTTCQDLINETKRRLMPTIRTTAVVLGADVTSGATTFTFTDGSINNSATSAILPGIVLSIDLEQVYVTGTVSGGTVAVSRGYNGSTAAAHSAGAVIYVNPRFSDFDILTAINHDLDDLSGGGGLYNIASLDISYNPVFQAYDLTGVSNLIEVIALRYKTILPDRKFRTIPSSRWEVLPAMTDSAFPSGYALNLNDSAFPGQPIHVTYKQGFTHLANYTDNVQSVSFLPATANDLPVLGAIISLVGPREIKRNQIESQGDPRLAGEVPASAIANSIMPEMRQREQRIASEAGRLKRQIGSMRRRY